MSGDYMRLPKLFTPLLDRATTSKHFISCVDRELTIRMCSPNAVVMTVSSQFGCSQSIPGSSH
ncbi:hypothetical protein FRX31_008144 [Thalictrum thalictroides]|uniref:Uncharacterized protein n=1 Tax=Thalictrum thalictroides TaxID=46969 RepID=A0A7J6X0G7_THATH|nr:hypothetical protein FRX31_008144 [Thalictrum thalictroides]